MVAACTPECLDLKNSIPRAGFYEYEGDPNKTISLPSITIYGIDAPGDSALMRNSSAKLIYLPLRLNVNECKYVFHYSYDGYNDDAHNDTLELSYTPLPQFISHECGALYFFKIDKVSHTTHLLRAEEHRDTVTNVDIEYLKLFFFDPTSETETDTGTEAGTDA